MIILFTLLMLGVFGKLIGLALKMAWGITKVVFILVFLPLILIGLVLAGFVYIAIPILVIAGIISLLS